MAAPGWMCSIISGMRFDVLTIFPGFFAGFFEHGIVRRALAGESNIDFHYCADARDALTIANQIKPTVILQDLVMPGGHELLYRGGKLGKHGVHHAGLADPHDRDRAKMFRAQLHPFAPC